MIHRPGGHDRLVVEEHDVPVPGDGEVRVRATAIGVNFADCVVRMGLYASAKEYVGWPITPGFEVAGRVDAVGAGAPFAVGDEVIALVRFGAYATHVIAPARQVFRRPPSLDPLHAAALSVAFLTAHYALFELGGVRAGQTILVHSAAGGVGSALVQLGKIAGARVVGVVGSAAKVDFAHDVGADVVIDASRGALWKEAERASPNGYDVVLDANGASTLRASFEHLARPGRLVVYGFHSMLSRGRARPSLLRLARTWLATPRFDPLAMTGANRSVLAFNLSYLFDRPELLDRAMHELLAWASEGKIRVAALGRFPLDAVREAHAALESGRTVGKIVLVA